MKCVVFVKFLPGGSLQPEDFFRIINAEQSWLEDSDQSVRAQIGNIISPRKPCSAMCIADFESVEQLAIDLAIMPGAGISNVEVVPVAEDSFEMGTNTIFPVLNHN